MLVQFMGIFCFVNMSFLLTFLIVISRRISRKHSSAISVRHNN